jgi:hypothetical protein
MDNRLITRTNVVRDGNRYCGPLVIAALLGCTTAEAAAKVRLAINTDKPINGMYNGDMLKTLVRVGGFDVKQLEVPKHYTALRRPGQRIEDTVEHCTNTWTKHLPDGSIRLWRPDNDGNIGGSAMTPVKRVGCTLAAWLRQRPDRAGTYVINVTDHYVLVVGQKFVDTATRGEWVSIRKAPHRRTRVENVWQVSR